MNNSSQNTPQPIIFWVLWAAILQGLFIIMFVAAGGFPEGHDKESVSKIMFLLCFSGVAFSSILRWVWLPKINNLNSLLPVMIIGLALAELTGILGLFVIGADFPETQRTLFIASVIGVIQYIPIYLSRFKEPAN